MYKTWEKYAIMVCCTKTPMNLLKALETRKKESYIWLESPGKIFDWKEIDRRLKMAKKHYHGSWHSEDILFQMKMLCSTYAWTIKLTWFILLLMWGITENHFKIESPTSASTVVTSNCRVLTMKIHCLRIWSCIKSRFHLSGWWAGEKIGKLPNGS